MNQFGRAFKRTGSNAARDPVGSFVDAEFAGSRDWREANKLITIGHSTLNNTYFLFRHGPTAIPADAHVIEGPVSELRDHSLSKHGKQCVSMAVKEAIKTGLFAGHQKALVISSPAVRAAQSAEIVCGGLRGAGFEVSMRLAHSLRERDFGEYTGQSMRDFKREVWPQDERDPFHTHRAVESPASVARRVSELICEEESRLSGHLLILVGHADVLQILNAATQFKSPSDHRKLGELKHCQWLRLTSFADVGKIESQSIQPG